MTQVTTLFLFFLGVALCFLRWPQGDRWHVIFCLVAATIWAGLLFFVPATRAAGFAFVTLSFLSLALARPLQRHRLEGGSMKLVLLGVLLIASAGPAAAQPDQSKCQDTARMVADDYKRMGTPHRPVTDSMARSVAQRTRIEVIERIRKQTGIGVAADCIESRSYQGDFRAQGNVTLTVGDIVITAEEAVIENGEIQLGNARVRLPAK